MAAVLALAGACLVAGLVWLARRAPPRAPAHRPSEPEDFGYRAEVGPAPHAVSTAFAQAAAELGLRHIQTPASEVAKGKLDGLAVTIDQLNRGTGDVHQDVTRVTIDSGGALPLDVALGTEAVLSTLAAERVGEPPPNPIVLDRDRAEAEVWAAALGESGDGRLLLAWGDDIGVALCRGQLVLEMAGTATDPTVLAAMVRDAAQLCRTAARNWPGVPGRLAAWVAEADAPIRRRQALRVLLRRFSQHGDVPGALDAARRDVDAGLRLEAALHAGAEGIAVVRDIALEPEASQAVRQEALAHLRAVSPADWAAVDQALREAPGQLSIASSQDQAGGLTVSEAEGSASEGQP